MRDTELTPSATDRRSVLAQYMGGANLRARVGLYEYLELGSSTGTDFGSWVLDHADWSGRETALDLGCGPGRTGPGLSGRASKVVALDISAPMLREYREHAASPVVEADAVHLPFVADSFEVVLAAHMLYHVSDVPGALSESRRVLRERGLLLAALNGAKDKAELRELWQEAASSALGQGARVSNWGARANLDNMPEVFGRYFSRVTVDRLPGRFHFPGPEPVLGWLSSLRSGTEEVIDDEQWEAVLVEVARRVNEWVREHGELVVTKDSGVIVAS